METDINRVWATRQEAAEYLRVSLSTVDRWIRSGRLDGKKAGWLVRIPWKSVYTAYDEDMRK